MTKTVLAFFALPIFFAMSLFGQVLPLFAETGHDSHELPPFSEFASYLVLYWVNFLIYIAVLVFALRKPIRNAFQSRSEKTAQHIQSARLALQDSEKTLNQAQQNSAGLNSKLEQIARDLKTETTLECEHMISDARAKSQRILKQAEESVAAEQKAAVRAVQKELIDLALKQSKEQLERELNAQADKSYRSSVLQNVKALVQ